MTAEQSKTFTDEALCFSIVKAIPRILLTFPKYASHSLSDPPFCVYFKHNSKTAGCLRLYYMLNDSSTTEDGFHG